MRRRTTRPALSTLAIAATSLLLAGCFTVEASFTINDDATADLDYLILIDTDQLQEFSGLLGEDAGALDELSGDALLQEFTGGEDPCADLTQELTRYEVSTRQIDDDGEVGVGCTVAGVPIAELDSLGDDTSSFSIEQDANGTRFDAVLEGVDELAGNPDETDAMAEMLGLDLDDLHPEFDPVPVDTGLCYTIIPLASQRALARVSLDLQLAADFERRDLITLLGQQGSPLEGKRYWLDVGDEDPFREADEALAKALDAGGAQGRPYIGEGGHESSYWSSNWRRYMHFYARALKRCQQDTSAAGPASESKRSG